ncbi:MAG: HAD family hydrolase [Deltaproteobacteria bacterium]|jgi:pyrophosphatase PpaX|nr:HAD family hydrolase [Deltaproteobacteria bacterium]
MLNTLIFDLDLTLVDSLEACHQATLLLSERFNLGPKTREEVLSAISLPTEEYWEKLYHRPVEPEWRSYFFSDILPRVDFNSPLYPETEEILAFCKQKGLLLGVATNRDRPWLDLAKMKIARFFDTAVGPDEGTRPKPDPDILHEALRRLGVGPATSLFVGDSLTDMLAAKNAGIRALGLLQGGASEAELLEAGAWKVKPNVASLRDFVENALTSWNF